MPQPRSFFLYWRWDTVLNELNAPSDSLRHVRSNQLGKVSPGDTLWIVSVPPSGSGLDDFEGRLILAGRLCVAFCTDDREEAARRLGTDDFWEAKWHAGADADAAEPMLLIRLDDAAELRFVGDHDRLTVQDGTINPQQLQTMRELTPDSAALLDQVWYAHRAVHAGVARFEIPNDVDLSGLDSDLVDQIFPDGRELLREHIRRERHPLAVHLVTEAALNAHGRLICTVCGFDFADAYGPVGARFIEAHHTRTLSELPDLTLLSTDDFALVCSNCHRMLHRAAPDLSVEDLRDLRERAAARHDEERLSRFSGPPLELVDTADGE